jgi:SAM-dependent methyltransferase
MGSAADIPGWADVVLKRDALGQVQDGVLRCGPDCRSAAVAYFQSIGGTHIFERAQVAYAMTTLDTPVYHAHLEDFAPADRNSVIVDVGGGDGRNTLPWLEWGFRRVVVIDPVAASLLRLRARVAADHPEWLDRILLIEADARHLPLRVGSADHMFAIESLCYLNEDYGPGVAECRRVLAPGGRLLVSDRH